MSVCSGFFPATREQVGCCDDCDKDSACGVKQAWREISASTALGCGDESSAQVEQ